MRACSELLVNDRKFARITRPVEVWSILGSACLYVCLLDCVSVCVLVCLSLLAYFKNQTFKFHQIFPTCYLWPCRFFSDCNAIRYVLPVLWITSCFCIMKKIGQNQRRLVYFVQVTKWRHRGRSLPLPTAYYVIWNSIIVVVVISVTFIRSKTIVSSYTKTMEWE